MTVSLHFNDQQTVAIYSMPCHMTAHLLKQYMYMLCLPTQPHTHIYCRLKLNKRYTVKVKLTDEFQVNFMCRFPWSHGSMHQQ